MNEKNVSVGAAIGVALLSWLLIGTICIVGTAIGASALFGLNDQSSGGIVGLICAIVCGINYKGSGNMGQTMKLAAIMGVVLCIVVLLASVLMMS